MLEKHVDVVALLVIALGLLAFSKPPEPRFFRDVKTAGVRVRNALGRTDVCPLSGAVIPRVR